MALGGRSAMEPDEAPLGEEAQPELPAESGARVHFGGLDARAAEIRARADRPPQQAAGEQELHELSASARAAQERLAAAGQEVLRKRVAREIEGEVPVMDDGVRAKLRELRQPVTLFGEGPYERRLRLRKYLAEGVVSGDRPLQVRPAPAPAAASTIAAAAAAQAQAERAAAGPGERFFTEGSAALKQARIDIAAFSLPRARDRVRRQAATLARLRQLTRAQRDAERSAACQGLSDFVCVASQVGGDRPLSGLAAAPDASCCLVASWDSCLRMYELPSCDLSQGGVYSGHSDRVTGVAWHPAARPAGGAESGAAGGCDFASVSADRSLKLWRAGQRGSTATLGGHSDRINKVAFHPSGNFVATTAHDRTWRLWDVAEGREAYSVIEQEGHARAPYGLDFHIDGSLLATSDISGVGRIWDLRHGRSIFTLEGHTKQVLAIRFSPNGWTLATGGDDHYVKLWDLRRRRLMETIAAHSGLVSGLCFEESNGHFLLSSSYDGTVKAWNAQTAEPIKTLRGHDNRVMGIDIVPGTGAIVTCAFDRTWKLWDRRGAARSAVADVTALLLDKSRSNIASDPPPGGPEGMDLDAAAKSTAQGPPADDGLDDLDDLGDDDDALQDLD
eukprot:TRINITY_DN1105_c1_g1_i1.p1 TRINITY_DN1105_c1_g1~~TRINITY_DN1105_c1_g1_i1.p1  ORF type:complete len:618 (+),score=117.37 TRINITY_DN1105_c1_g1_i1:33-1886(+)